MSKAVKGKLGMIARNQGIPDLWEAAARHEWAGPVAVFEVEGKPSMGEVMIVPVAEYETLLERAEPPNTEKLLEWIDAQPGEKWYDSGAPGWELCHPVDEFTIYREKNGGAVELRDRRNQRLSIFVIRQPRDVRDIAIHAEQAATAALAAIAAQNEPATGEEGG
jgi:hypothetical protein